MDNQLGVAALPALALTVGAFVSATALNRHFGGHPLCNPVLLSVAIIIGVLQFGKISYEQYFQGGQILHFFLGPAVVALAVPLYRQRDTVRKLAIPLLTGVVAGSCVGVLSVVILGRTFGMPEPLIAALATKSITAPVAMGIAQNIGGVPALSAGMAVLTGILVAAFGPAVLTRMGFRTSTICGLAMGVTGHGQGTARIIQEDEAAGAIAGLAMGLTALLSAIFLPIVWSLLAY